MTRKERNRRGEEKLPVFDVVLLWLFIMDLLYSTISNLIICICKGLLTLRHKLIKHCLSPNVCTRACLLLCANASYFFLTFSTWIKHIYIFAIPVVKQDLLNRSTDSVIKWPELGNWSLHWPSFNSSVARKISWSHSMPRKTNSWRFITERILNFHLSRSTVIFSGRPGDFSTYWVTNLTRTSRRTRTFSPSLKIL